MNYRDELYKNIIINAKDKYGNAPLRDEAKRLGVNLRYIKKKYGGYTKFVNHIGMRIIASRKPSEVKRILFDKEKNEIVMETPIYEISSYLNISKELARHYLNSLTVKNKYYIFSKFEYIVFERSNFDYTQYRLVMYYKYNKNYIRKPWKKYDKTPRKWNRKGLYTTAISNKEKLDKGLVELSDLIDVEKYKDLYIEDFK